MKLSAVNFLMLQAKMSFKQLLVYRMSTMMIVIFGFLSVFSEYLVINVYFSFDTEIEGWTKDAFLILFGTFNCMVVLYQFLFEIGHDQFAYKVKYGELDFDILRPYDTMFLSSFSQFEYAALTNLILPIYFIYAGIIGTQIELSPLIISMFFLSILLGTYVIYLLNQLFITLSFWLSNFSNFYHLTETAVQLGSKPIQVYPWLIQLTFGLFLPIIVALNLPANVLLGHVSFTQVAIMLLGICLLTITTRLIWNIGLNRYSSASS